MNLKKIAISILLVAIIIVGISSTIVTALPNEFANKVNYLGYKSVCPFSPFSTIISAVIAVIAFLIGKRVVWK